jgi:alkylhydroperoxidase/carboxymuconolactone decarboxylase family protein YurZ
MTPNEVRLLRGLLLHETDAIDSVMSGDGRRSAACLDPHTAALIKIAVLLSVDSDDQAIRWAIDEGIAAGIEDAELFDTLMIVAPVVGKGRTTSVLSKLLGGLDIDLLDESHLGDAADG